MEESNLNALLAHISRLEGELASLRKTVAGLAGGGVLPSSTAVESPATDATTAASAEIETVPTHPSGLVLDEWAGIEGGVAALPHVHGQLQ